MLNRGVCQKCYSERFGRANYFDSDWKVGVVDCIGKANVETGSYRFGLCKPVYDGIPECCPYFLEHTVSYVKQEDLP